MNIKYITVDMDWFGQVEPDDLATHGLTKEVAAGMTKRQMNGGDEVGGFVPLAHKIEYFVIHRTLVVSAEK